MNRRTFLCGLTVGTLAAPIIAVAQQARKSYRLGVLAPNAPPDPSDLGSGIVLLRKHLLEMGHIEGQNLIIESRFADGKFDRLPALARELVGVHADVIVAFGESAIRAAKDATRMIPIVMAFGVDPVGRGFVKSLASPGGNITGVSYWVGRQPALCGRDAEGRVVSRYQTGRCRSPGW
jgi:putative tryptophan/tyrosine transport system substrate-binding protein